MPQYIKEAYPMNPLPQAFADENLHSSYLVNEWESLSAFLIVFSFGIVFGILERFMNRTKHMTVILIIRRLRMLTQWNFVLFLIFNSYDDLTFFFILELQTLSLGSFASFVSLFLAIIITVIALYLLFKSWQVTRQYSNIKSKVRDELAINDKDLFYHKWERFQVTYSGFKQDSRLKHSCLFITTARVLLCYIIVGCLYEKPVIQTILFNIFSILMITYMLGLRPIIDKFNFFVVMMFEVLIFVVNICILIVANLDAYEAQAEHVREGLGQAIIIANSIIDFCSNIFMWMYILLGLRAAYRIHKMPGRYKKTVWLNLIVVPYQNPGMEFNELSNKEIELLASETPRGIQTLATSQMHQNKSHYKQLEHLGTIPTDPDEDKNAYTPRKTDTMETISSGGEENDNRKLMKGSFGRILPIKRRITLKRLQVSDDPDSGRSTPRSQNEVWTNQKSFRKIASKNTLPLKVPSIIVEESSPLERKRKESYASQNENSRRSPDEMPDILTDSPRLLSLENDESKAQPRDRVHFVSVLDYSGGGARKENLVESFCFSPSPRMTEDTPRESSRFLQAIRPVEILSVWNNHRPGEMNGSPRTSRNEDSKIDTVCFEDQENPMTDRPLITERKPEQKALRTLKRALNQETGIPSATASSKGDQSDSSIKNSQMSEGYVQTTEEKGTEKFKSRLSMDIKSLVFGVPPPLRKSTFQRRTVLSKQTITQLSPDSSPNHRSTLSQVYVSSINIKESNEESVFKPRKIISKESLH